MRLYFFIDLTSRRIGASLDPDGRNLPPLYFGRWSFVTSQTEGPLVDAAELSIREKGFWVSPHPG